MTTFDDHVYVASMSPQEQRQRLDAVWALHRKSTHHHEVINQLRDPNALRNRLPMSCCATCREEVTNYEGEEVEKNRDYPCDTMQLLLEHHYSRDDPTPMTEEQQRLLLLQLLDLHEPWVMDNSQERLMNYLFGTNPWDADRSWCSSCQESDCPTTRALRHSS